MISFEGNDENNKIFLSARTFSEEFISDISEIENLELDSIKEAGIIISVKTNYTPEL